MLIIYIYLKDYSINRSLFDGDKLVSFPYLKRKIYAIINGAYRICRASLTSITIVVNTIPAFLLYRHDLNIQGIFT